MNAKMGGFGQTLEQFKAAQEASRQEMAQLRAQMETSFKRQEELDKKLTLVYDWARRSSQTANSDQPLRWGQKEEGMKNIIATLAFASVLGSMPVLAQANTGSTQNETRIHAPADWDKSGGVTRLEVAVKLCPKGIPLSEGPAAYGEMSWAKYHELVLDVCVETTQQQFDAAWAGWKTPPQPQQAAAPASQEPVEQAPAAASTKEARVVLPVPTMHRPRGYQSFENVAEESLHVQTRSGKSYDLRSTGGNTRACEPPRQLVRSERCTKLGNGGIRCAFDCR